MDHFLTSIQINKIFHLKDIKIDIDEKEKKHLLITGKNGCGKTSLLNALVDFLQRIRENESSGIFNVRSRYLALQEYYEQERKGGAKDSQLPQTIKDLKEAKKEIDIIYGKLESFFTNAREISELLHNDNFLFAFYSANRKTEVYIPQNPEKPNLVQSHNIKESLQREFVKFLVDLKVQEALARNENQLDYANEIKVWFENFEGFLNELFEGEQVKLHFNFKNYVFTIQQNGREFGFNELSDGYSAIIDIIADLILKMQDPEILTRAYNKQGIVLIDEIETHLHLELQKAILPMLTRVFPNIQFIVTTHSPFVLNSIDNAIAYDLEKRERLEDLHEYSYEALAEGYFDVSTESSFLESKLKRLKLLLGKEKKDSEEEAEMDRLDIEFKEALEDALTPESVKIQYQQIKLNS